ncbi:hypothetical protein PR048_025034 [Dryococelus australis]|uniref:DUF7869 domain-containing protein n=1 Tax=Dryococelus australis TaxID=614101 RepID=A0ABQ9GQA6_9NEOP|nr:hypothetical protein PR048_025034 [Dryococelus australis]
MKHKMKADDTEEESLRLEHQKNETCMFLDYIKNLREDKIIDLVSTSDECLGQNKNRTIMQFLYYLVHVLKLYCKTSYTFLFGGHTYMPNDRDFSLISQREITTISAVTTEGGTRGTSSKSRANTYPNPCTTYIVLCREPLAPYLEIPMLYHHNLGIKPATAKTSPNQWTTRKALPIESSTKTPFLEKQEMVAATAETVDLRMMTIISVLAISQLFKALKYGSRHSISSLTYSDHNKLRDITLQTLNAMRSFLSAVKPHRRRPSGDASYTCDLSGELSLLRNNAGDRTNVPHVSGVEWRSKRVEKGREGRSTNPHSWTGGWLNCGRGVEREAPAAPLRNASILSSTRRRVVCRSGGGGSVGNKLWASVLRGGIKGGIAAAASAAAGYLCWGEREGIVKNVKPRHSSPAPGKPPLDRAEAISSSNIPPFPRGNTAKRRWGRDWG